MGNRVVQVGLHERHVSDTMLEIRILERLYEGPPRWDRPDRCEELQEKENKHLRPAPRIAKRIYEAWGFRGIRDAMTAHCMCVATCVTPDCPQREQRDVTEYMNQPGYYFHAEITERCDGCGEVMQGMLARPPVSKYLYVLVGETPRVGAEIFIDKNGLFHGLPNAGPTPRAKRRPREGHSGAYPTLSVKAGVPYQFFLSPVQLSGPAVRKLLDVAADEPAVNQLDVATGQDNEQRLAATVRRTFRGPAYADEPLEQEWVGVADPVEMIHRVNAYDFMPASAALMELRTHKAEQAKQQIASVLASVIGEPPWLSGGTKKYDEYDLVDELTRNAKRAPGNAAKQWLESHEKREKRLAEETEGGAQRLISWLDSSAHLIVEKACQTPEGSVRPLAFALTHYGVVLFNLGGSASGLAYLQQLATGGKSGKYKSRIPYHNVLHPSDTQRSRLVAVREKFGDLGAAIVMALSGPLIRANKEGGASAMASHLLTTGVPTRGIHVKEAEGPDYSEMILSSVKLGIQIDELRNAPEFDEVPDAKFLSGSWRQSLLGPINEFLGRNAQISDLINIATGAAVYSKQDKPGESHIKRLSRDAAKVEYPLKVLDFGLDHASAALALRAEQKYGATFKGLEDGLSSFGHEGTVIFSAETTPSTLAAVQRARRLQRFHYRIGLARGIYAGPISVVFSTITFAVESEDAIKAWDSGETGLATGHAILAAGAVVSMVSAGLITVALFSSTFAAALGGMALLGPLGIIAGALLLVGGTVVACCTPNMLERFASHCFIGSEYGKGGDVPIFVHDGWPYRHWAHKEGIFHQLQYLQNIITAFHMTLGLDTATSQIAYYSYPYNCKITFGYLPAGSFLDLEFEIELERKNEKGTWVDYRPRIEATISLDTGKVVSRVDKRHVEVFDPNRQPVRLEPSAKAYWGGKNMAGLFAWVELEKLDEQRYRRKEVVEMANMKARGYSWRVGARLHMGLRLQQPPPSIRTAIDRWVRLRFGQGEGAYPTGDSLTGPYKIERQ